MGRILLLFIQSRRTDTYVNVLAHCIIDEGIRDIYFAGAKETAGRKSDLFEFIEDIRSEVDKLAKDHDGYTDVLRYFPISKEVESRIIRMPFVDPEQSIPQLIERFDVGELIVDITGCSKQLAGDVLVSYMVRGIDHIRYFQLSEKVLTKEWEFSKMYHDLKKDGIRYYEYDDFADHDTILHALHGFQSQNTECWSGLNAAVTYLTGIKEHLDKAAQKGVQRGLWVYLGILVAVWLVLVGLMRLLGWATMEPWTYFIGVGGTLCSFAFFVVTHKECSPRSIYEQAIASRRRRIYREFGFDLGRYAELVEKAGAQPLKVSQAN